MSILLAFLALAIEAVVGYPDRIYRLIGHPVTWFGRLISMLDRRLNDASRSNRFRRFAGVVALIVLAAVAALAAWMVQTLLAGGVLMFGAAILASSLTAQRSLHSHVRAVADALETGGIDAGRKAVSQIVGRDPQTLDEAGVSRAAIESLAENFSDGVVAPAFWLAVAGLPGGAVYKAVNTADSMIGHKTPKHQAFGWAAARFDDLINLPASRLSALLILAACPFVAGASARAAWRAVWRDAKHHRSPNAGWPEAAMAGAIGVALAGPRSYGGVMVDDVFMGEGGRRAANAADIRKALALFVAADVLLVAVLGIMAAAIMLHG